MARGVRHGPDQPAAPAPPGRRMVTAPHLDETGRARTAAPAVAADLCAALVEAGFGPYFGTPCGILAPLYAAVERRPGLLTVAREDNAVGIAAGASLAGRYPVVLMQNSGLGQSVNALADRKS